MEFSRLNDKLINLISAAYALYMIIFALGFFLVILMLISNLWGMSVPSYLILTPMQHMGMYLSGILLISFVTHPLRKNGAKWYDWLMGLAGATGGLYIFFVYPELMLRMGITTTLDVVFGLITIFFLLEAGRRTTGTALSVLTLIFILIGLYDAEFDISSLVTRIYLYNVGIFSTPFQVATFMIFIFMFFGALLSEIGVGKFFTDMAFALTGARKGGPAKVAVLASSLLGTMSGSATGNVVTTGTFTIPLMKKAGYKAETAGAIEASASTGGQLMPPVLGSAAFIMPLFLGIRYWDVVIASVIPALLYYLALYIFVDQEASKQRAYGVPKDQLPPLRPLLLKLYYLLPLVVLISVLSSGFSVEHAAVASIMAALFIEWFTRAGLRKLFGAVFTIFIFGIGFMLASSGLDIFSILVVVGAISLFITMGIGVVLKGAEEMTSIVVRSLASSFKSVTPVAVACALAGVIAGVLAYTGLALTLSQFLVQLSGGNIIILLILVVGITILLGMGMPTPAVYVLCATSVAPALVEMGIPPIAAHFFIFYFGILAPLTPPVAITAYAGAAVAKADFWKTGIEAFRMALIGWFIAFSFISKPEMLILPIKSLSLPAVENISFGVIASVLAALLSGGVVSGYLFGHLSILQRISFAVALAFLLISLFYFEYLILVALAILAFLNPIAIRFLKKPDFSQ
ncbi:TRAP transporter fused permease subunit [Archaeoglobus neptunius]|uniref:TRAP transporter fused permease subunit n=1 Tax=Archaeoglobus neptunius TaxID=2798580 RepID=UPI0019280AA5|nr:TRAP transporter fused permease subunit [Archaeoglobus neptunius]